jgi:hypothetical protein
VESSAELIEGKTTETPSVVIIELGSLKEIVSKARFAIELKSLNFQLSATGPVGTGSFTCAKIRVKPGKTKWAMHVIDGIVDQVGPRLKVRPVDSGFLNSSPSSPKNLFRKTSQLPGGGG